MGVAPTFLGDLRRTVCTWGSCHWLVAVSRVKSPLLATYSDAGASRSTAVNLETCRRVWGGSAQQPSQETKKDSTTTLHHERWKMNSKISSGSSGSGVHGPPSAVAAPVVLLIGRCVQKILALRL